MAAPDFILRFVRPLNQAGIRYFVSGSVAAIFYGEPRLTLDVDFVVFLRADQIGKLAEIFPAAEFYVPPAEVIAAEIAREKHGHFNLIHGATGAKADFYPTGRDELNVWAIRAARRVEFQGEPLVLAPVESVIVSKLEFFREGRSEKHLRDIRGILRVSAEQVNHAVLQDWIARRGLAAEWQLVAG